MRKVDDDRRIRVITGHYGSGKTEFSANYAKYLAKTHDKVAIADLDVINTYFRSRELQKEFEKLGIEIIGASVEASAVDVPAISAEVMRPIENEEYQFILDVGGNPAGARALGRFRKDLLEQNPDHFFVVNRNRPETANADDVIAFIRQTEAICGIPVTKLINSTHMLKDTQVSDVLYGQELCEELSEKLGLPIAYISCRKEIVDQLPEELQEIALPIELTMRQTWMS